MPGRGNQRTWCGQAETKAGLAECVCQHMLLPQIPNVSCCTTVSRTVLVGLMCVGFEGSFFFLSGTSSQIEKENTFLRGSLNANIKTQNKDKLPSDFHVRYHELVQFSRWRFFKTSGTSRGEERGGTAETLKGQTPAPITAEK